MSQFEIVVMLLVHFNTQFKVEKKSTFTSYKVINQETFWQQEQL